MAKTKISPGMMVFGAVLLLVLVGGFYAVSQTQIISNTDKTCGIDTLLTINPVNALAKGTAVSSPSYYAVVNDEIAKSFTSGTTTLSPGDDVKILTSASNYIDQVDQAGEIKCGSNTLTPEVYATDDVAAIEIYNDDGNKMTDAIGGGATNQTVLNAGEALTVQVKFKGVNQQSTGDLIYVVEAGSAANVSDITMSGNAEKLTSIPSVHTTQAAGSKVVAFKIPAVIGATTSTYDMTFTLVSAKTLTGGVYTDVYSQQAFVDTDGTFKVGIQDAVGTAKYEDTSDSDFYIDAA